MTTKPKRNSKRPAKKGRRSVQKTARRPPKKATTRRRHERLAASQEDEELNLEAAAERDPDDAELPTMPPRHVIEEKLSVEPEDLGKRFLRDVVEPESEPNLAADLQEWGEPSEPGVDLHSDAIREGSLFDQPTAAGTRTPYIRADDTGEVENAARERAERSTRETMGHGRPVAEKPSHR